MHCRSIIVNTGAISYVALAYAAYSQRNTPKLIGRSRYEKGDKRAQ